jgi:hypothetical protein
MLSLADSGEVLSLMMAGIRTLHFARLPDKIVFPFGLME